MDGETNYDALLGQKVSDRKSYTDPNPKSDSKEARDASHARNLRDMAAPGWLYCVMATTLGETIGPDAFVYFRDLMLKEAGNPSDPIERMLIEQLALAHFSIGQLRIRACTVDNAKLAIAFSDSATRLLGEFRRCSLALEDYRAKQASRSTADDSTDSAVHPAHHQTNGYAKPSSNGQKKHADTEVARNGNGEMPEWLRKRMACPTPNGSPPAAETSSNGKA